MISKLDFDEKQFDWLKCVLNWATMELFSEHTITDGSDCWCGKTDVLRQSMRSSVCLQMSFLFFKQFLKLYIALPKLQNN